MIRRMPKLAGWLAALTLAACASNAASTVPTNPTTPPPSDPAPGTVTQVTGSVMYRERIALTPDAVLEVEVAELTPEGNPGTVIGQQTLRSPGQVPIGFSVDINPQRLRPEATYVVNARITDGTRGFSTTAPVPVLTQGNRSTDVQVLLRSGR